MNIIDLGCCLLGVYDCKDAIATERDLGTVRRDLGSDSPQQVLGTQDGLNKAADEHLAATKEQGNLDRIRNFLTRRPLYHPSHPFH